MFPLATDWDGIYLPVVRMILSGQNPFNTFGFYNPPWVLSLLIPFAMLPYEIGRFLMMLCGMASLAYVAYRLKASRFGVIAILLSPLAFDAMLWGNVEWISLLGLVLPLPLGLVLLSIKPQMTLCAIGFLLYEEWRKRGFRKMILAMFPVTALFILSFLVYGFYPLHWMQYQAEAGINFSFYPFTVPLGLGLMIQATRTKKLGYALAASPLFFSTLSPQVWLVEWLAIAALTPELIAVTVSSWGIVMMQKVGL